MVGNRDNNLRRGDLAEQLGTFLLQGLAAVAPVPRTEDVGIDSIATLLRRDGPRRLIAEDSFCVQFKSANQEEIEYSDDQILWLKSLDLPLFIGHVDLKRGEIALFPGHEIYRWLADDNIDRQISKLRLILLSGSPIGFDSQGECRLHLGPPILTWSVPDLSNKDFLLHAYEVLKAHLDLIRMNRASIVAGFHRIAKWNTNEPPQNIRPSQCAGGTDRLLNTLNDAWPILHSLYFNLLTSDRADLSELLYRFLTSLSDLGWTLPDDGNMLHLMQKFQSSNISSRSVADINETSAD